MKKATKTGITMDEIVSFCKRRGFLFQSSEIYGGLQGLYDYGPLGVELKNQLKLTWWKSMVYERDDIEGLDAAILTHRATLRHSGHEATFSDPMVDCLDCKHRMRSDHLKKRACDRCGSLRLTEERPFNLMLKTHLGPIDDGSNLAYLRPETAQSIFVNFRNVVDATSRKAPFGIAQIGKAFRNEVTPKNFIFRVREFEQMELEFFVEPNKDEEWHRYWVNQRYEWWLEQGLAKEDLFLQPQPKEELAHYSKATTDILYRFPFGTEEIEGIANRIDFDLGSHTKDQEELSIQAKVEKNEDSTVSLSLQDRETQGRFIPYVIEPSAGLDRGVLALLVAAYTRETIDSESERIVLKLRPHLAPIKVAVVPLAKNNERIVNKAKEIKSHLQKLGIGRMRYEDTGNVGKAYRRHDEIGTPLCITVDFETFEGSTETVTIRDRDSMKQKRVAVDELNTLIPNFFKGAPFPI